MLRRRVFVLAAICAAPLQAATGLEQQFTQTVRPFVDQYCSACHSGDSPAAQFDLESYKTLDSVVRDNAALESRGRPSHCQRDAAQAHAATAGGTPPAGHRLDQSDAHRRGAQECRRSRRRCWPRRLSNAEYNYTIRDLTGVDMRPTREFPVDPANPAGFDNSGESLTMSPALLNKYLQAAREVGDHMVLTPDGFDFAPLSHAGGNR